MFEKVNKYHPDKIADRIAGALVDLAVAIDSNARCAVEVLIGHGKCHIINETSVKLNKKAVAAAVYRIAGNVKVDYKEVAQDKELAKNQADSIRCGDNGIFLGMPVTSEQRTLTHIAKELEAAYGSDGKYIYDEHSNTIIICQSNTLNRMSPLYDIVYTYYGGGIPAVNPLGHWTGGTNVDTGATNRKLGSDMADSATGGGLIGKDLSKADVSVNIYCWLMAQNKNRPIKAFCAIGDTKVYVDGKYISYEKIVQTAREYIEAVGGYEAFAEYGLIR